MVLIGEDEVPLDLRLLLQVVLKVLVNLEEILSSVRLLEDSLRWSIEWALLEVLRAHLVREVTPVGLGNDGA